MTRIRLIISSVLLVLAENVLPKDTSLGLSYLLALPDVRKIFLISHFRVWKNSIKFCFMINFYCNDFNFEITL